MGALAGEGGYLGAGFYPQHAVQIHVEAPLVDGSLASLCHGLRCAAVVWARQVLFPCMHMVCMCAALRRWRGGGGGGGLCERGRVAVYQDALMGDVRSYAVQRHSLSWPQRQSNSTSAVTL